MKPCNTVSLEAKWKKNQFRFVGIGCNVLSFDSSSCHNLHNLFWTLVELQSLRWISMSFAKPMVIKLIFTRFSWLKCEITSVQPQLHMKYNRNKCNAPIIKQNSVAQPVHMGALGMQCAVRSMQMGKFIDTHPAIEFHISLLTRSDMNMKCSIHPNVSHHKYWSDDFKSIF